MAKKRKRFCVYTKDAGGITQAPRCFVSEAAAKAAAKKASRRPHGARVLHVVPGEPYETVAWYKNGRVWIK